MKLFDPSNNDFEDDDDIMELDIKTPPSTTKDNTSDKAAFGAAFGNMFEFHHPVKKQKVDPKVFDISDKLK